MSEELTDERWAPSRIEEVGEAHGDVYVLGLRETADDPESWSLLLMEPLDEGYEWSDDAEMDAYCLVVDPGQAVVYGGVLECELAEDRLRLLLTEEAATELATPTELTFTLAIPSEQRALVGPALTRVLTAGRRSALPRVLNV